ncbi:mechanosensitive ion channel family protein [Pseudaminobacter arsenicus]|uniref:Mechanosensitive ion channel family protein n=1 Tax=Borborobacter arsenicus TaxID=1851146 RepID=A0A432V9K7_9HYPH|nr:mechanosensitive ion channel family protein [Pseudaminobacter arsenicus]
MLFVAAGWPDAALAQAVTPANGTTGGVVAEQRQTIERLAAQLDTIEKEIEAGGEDEEGLVENRAELETIGKSLLGSGVAFRPRLTEINSRIEQLGPPPAEGQPAEPELVAKERQALTTEKAEINVLLGNAEDLSVRVHGLINTISTLRRELFTTMLTKRYRLGDAFSGEVGGAVQHEFGALYKSISSWLRFVVQFKYNAVLTATFLALLAAAALQFGGKRLFRRLFYRDAEDEDPSYLSRLSVAFWSTLLPSIAVSVFLNATIGLYNYFNVLRGDIGVLLNGVGVVIFIAFFVNRLSHAVFSPDMPAWRLLPIEPRPGRLLVWLMTIMALVVGFDYLMGVISETLSSPLSVTILKSLVAAITVGLLLVLIGTVRPFADEEGAPRPWPPTLRFLFYFLGAVTIISALLGYVSFAQFVSRQIVITGAILATAYIGFLSSRAIAEEGSFANTAVGRRLQERYGTDETMFDQLGLAASVLINILIVAVLLPLVLFQWGFQPGDIATWLDKLATGFKIGSFSFSPFAIVTGLIVFAIGYFLTRWFQGWLDGSVMARGKVDTGVRNSIRTVVGYAGLAIAALIGISAAGIDLSNFALIAGGLSLGIGFGLQNVVSNFVSGLILLAERPFKAGDWIVAGAVSGTVKKISVRATEIETFQRQTVILPNSELINSAVGNWTHRNKLGRIEVKVGVAYGSDVRRVHEILLEIARNHPLVLKNPEPFVLFANFGPAALEFEIRAFLADINNGSGVQNDIRFAIIDAFEGAGIPIPSTPRFIEPPPEPKWPADDEKAEAQHYEAEQAKARQAAEARPRRRSKRPDPE